MDANTFIPPAFIDDVKRYLPAHLSLDDFLAACRSPLKRAVRVNTLKISLDDFKQYCAQKNWQLTPIAWCETGFWLQRPSEEERTLPIGNTDLHLSGCMYVQEASSMLPPAALFSTLEKPAAVLDMAAAPGSKTTQIAALMAGDGLLIANEYSSSRLKMLAANLKRMGVYNGALSHFDGTIFGDYMSECFDAILLDAPCSGEGTVRKDPNALKNWSLASNISISDTQKQLIKSAFYALKTGGSLVYSTCTLTPVENQAVCDFLLQEFAGMVEIEPLDSLFTGAEKAATREGYLHVWPQIFDSEGFFIAKFKKTASAVSPTPQKKKGAFPFTAFAAKAEQHFLAYLAKQFGLPTLTGQLMQRDNELWLFPDCDPALFSAIKYSRIGVQVGVIHKNGVRLSHELAVCFGKLATKNTYALSATQAADFFKGQDIRLDDRTIQNAQVQQKQAQKGEVILLLNHAPVGLGKWQGNKIKNNLPRELIQNGQLITHSAG